MADLFPALLLTTFAGLATLVGGAGVVFSPARAERLIAPSLAIAAGAMCTVSLVEILPEALSHSSASTTLLWGFAGAAIPFLLGWLPPLKNAPSTGDLGEHASPAMFRTAILTSGVLIAHNAPEGLATFTAGFHGEVSVALTLVAAIALHNIPEGLAVAAPIYAATRSRAKALALTAVAGLSEPLGALFLWWIAGPAVIDRVYGGMMAAIAGIMLAVSAKELLPAAMRVSPRRKIGLWCATGVLVMFLSLWALRDA